MKANRQIARLFAGVLVLGMAGCASTSMTHTWSDPEWKGPQIKKVLIIGVADRDANRRIFEDKFKAELAKEKVDAISSYTVLPSGQLTEDAINSKLGELGVDGIVVSRVVDKRTVDTIYPPTTTYVAGSPYWPSYYGGYYGYYSTSYSAYTSPGYTETTDYVYVETNLYSAKTGKLIWTGMSETAMDPGRADQLIDGVISVLMREIRTRKG
jgi:hypothetical protein